MAVGAIMSRVTRSIHSSADACDEDPPALGRWPGSLGSDEPHAPTDLRVTRISRRSRRSSELDMTFANFTIPLRSMMK